MRNLTLVKSNMQNSMKRREYLPRESFFCFRNWKFSWSVLGLEPRAELPRNRSWGASSIHSQAKTVADD
jgi:hypothetical protein